MNLANRNSVNRWAFSVNTSESYFLCSMTSRQTGLTTSFISDPVNTKVSGNNLYIYFTENSTEDKENGVVSLSPAGEWDLFLYEQSSSSNLDPDNATILLTETIRVDDAGAAVVAFSGTCADAGGGGGSVNVYESDGATHISGSPFSAPASKTLQGADIINADDLSIITTLEDGDSYNVYQLSGIRDNGGPYSSTIVDDGSN